MSRGQFAVLTVLLSVAVVVGAVAGVFFMGSSGSASAQELHLAPPPASSSAIVVPSFAELAERAIPSVVLVTNTSVTSEDPHADLPFFRRFFREPFGDNKQEQRPAPERRQVSTGSGFFITEDGYLLTNRHVVEGADQLKVRDSDDKDYDAELVGVDPALDLALLKVDGSGFPALALGDSNSLRVGEWVVAIGNPISFRSSVTVGVVSGKGRRLGFDPNDLSSYIQTDAAINFGNSGGPLLNVRGEVVGINTAIIRGDRSPFSFSQSNLVEGMSFALPISKAKPVLDQLVSTGTVKRGYLGISVGPIDEEKAEYLHLPGTKGAYVNRVDKDTPADSAGVREDDVIIDVDGQPIGDQSELVDTISSHRPGEKVRLGIVRKGERMNITVTLGTRPTGKESAAPAPSGVSPSGDEVTDLGISVSPLPPSMRDALESAGVEGLLITHVDIGSNAYEKGLREGMILMDVNDMPVRSLDDYRKAAKNVQPGQVVKVRVAFSSGDQALIFFREPEKGD